MKGPAFWGAGAVARRGLGLFYYSGNLETMVRPEAIPHVPLLSTTLYCTGAHGLTPNGSMQKISSTRPSFSSEGEIFIQPLYNITNPQYSRRQPSKLSGNLTIETFLQNFSSFCNFSEAR